MEKEQKQKITVQSTGLYDGTAIQENLREVRNLLIFLLGGYDQSKTPVNTLDLANALYALNYLTENVEYINE